jgi:hypothetical protein
VKKGLKVGLGVFGGLMVIGAIGNATSHSTARGEKPLS